MGECQQKNRQMTDQAPTLCYRCMPWGYPFFRQEGVRVCVIRSIFDVAGNISAQPPPKKSLMLGQEVFKTLLFI